MKVKKEEIIKKIKKNIRTYILIFFVILFTIFSLRHFILGGGVSASVDALCPFGGFETLFSFISTGGFIPRILMSSLVLAFGILLTVIIFNKGFCGYICPFGTINEWMFKLSKKEIKIKEKYDKKLVYIKYLVLVIILIGTYYLGTLIFRDYDPFMTFFHFGKGIFWDYETAELMSHLIPFGILTLILVGSIFIKRLWCKYLCPLGAIMTIFSKLSFTRIKFDKKKCVKCGICKKKCPMGVKDITKYNFINTQNCINCNTCVNVCSKKALTITTCKKQISTKNYMIGTIGIFFMVIGISMLFGIWQSVPNTSLNDLGGNLNADNIKGWMTLGDISKETGIELYHFIYELGLPKNIDPNTKLKEIGKIYNLNFETENLREFVRNYNGGRIQCPWKLEVDTAPGSCGLYIDTDKNYNCDLSSEG